LNTRPLITSLSPLATCSVRLGASMFSHACKSEVGGYKRAYGVCLISQKHKNWVFMLLFKYGF
jgi:hypothetical protein